MDETARRKSGKQNGEQRVVKQSLWKGKQCVKKTTDEDVKQSEEMLTSRKEDARGEGERKENKQIGNQWGKGEQENHMEKRR